MKHEIERETVFFTVDNGMTYEKKGCDFFIHCRNENTNNRLKIIASVQNYNMTQHIDQGPQTVRIDFPNSEVYDTYIIVEWYVTADLKGIRDLDMKDRRSTVILERLPPEIEYEDVDEAKKRIEQLQELLYEETKLKA